MQPIPIARYLVPERPLLAPEGFTRIDSTLRAGVPHAIPLTQAARLLLVAPTGVAAFWRDANSSLVVSESDTELAPHAPPGAGQPLALAPLWNIPFRLLLQIGGRTVGVAPLIAGLEQRLPEAGDAAARFSIVVLGWRIHAGTLRGAPDEPGSIVSVAWRAADAAVNAFSEPPLNPVFVKRQPPEKRLLSEVGRLKKLKFPRRSQWRFMKAVIE